MLFVSMIKLCLDCEAVSSDHCSCQRKRGLPSAENSSGSQTYRESGKFHWFQRSAIKMNASSRPCTGMTNVLCEWKVLSASVPAHGLPSSVHGPKMLSATAERAALGAQAEQPDANR